MADAATVGVLVAATIGYPVAKLPVGCDFLADEGEVRETRCGKYLSWMMPSLWKSNDSRMVDGSWPGQGHKWEFTSRNKGNGDRC